MRKGQLAVLLAAAAVVAVLAAVSSGGGGGKGAGKPSSATAAAGAAAKPAPGAVIVSVASSPEKLALMQDLARRFNASPSASVGGRRAFVRVANASSGDEELAIAQAAKGAGGDRPTVWAPSSSLWGRVLDFQADRPLVPDKNPSIVRTPLVIAMWEPLARALGYPRKRLGFADILRLARDRRGWAAYGHPEYGDFKLVHTNPSVSTSGLEAVAAEEFAATGKREGLTTADVDRPRVRAQIRGIEQSIVHYGDTTLFISDQLKKNGPGYASAVAMEEATLVDFNRTRGSQTKLVAIYPAEGTFYSDDPFIVLRAPWVSTAQARAAEGFRRFIAAHLTPQTAARFGFRPADLRARPLAPVDAAHGVDPRQPARVLALPDPPVLARVQRAWAANRKAANIELVVDTSGSMNQGAKLRHAKQGLAVFLRALSPRDRVGLTTFSASVDRLVPVTPFAVDAATVRERVRGLFASGDTALYDAVDAGLSTVTRLRDRTRINAVVVLTDGQDTASTGTSNALLSRLNALSRAEGPSVRVFTIAYGRDADAQVLDRIAAASGGKAFIGDTQNIEAVYRSISSFF